MNNGSREYNISNEELIEGILEVTEIIKENLEIFKKAYREPKDPLDKIEIEAYAKTYVELVILFKNYTNRIERNIELQPIIVFQDNKALFGYREKKDLEFSKKWFERIVFKNNKEHTEFI